MKKLELRQIIREEISRVLNEQVKMVLESADDYPDANRFGKSKFYFQWELDDAGRGMVVQVFTNDDFDEEVVTYLPKTKTFDYEWSDIEDTKVRETVEDDVKAFIRKYKQPAEPKDNDWELMVITRDFTGSINKWHKGEVVMMTDSDDNDFAKFIELANPNIEAYDDIEKAHMRMLEPFDASKHKRQAQHLRKWGIAY